MAFFVKDSGLKPYEKLEPKRFPTISVPKIIGHFSIDGNQEYRADARICRYLHRDWRRHSIRFDLNSGYDKAIHQLDSEENLDTALTYIAQNFNRMSDGERINCDFVCFRGLLRQIMCTPYDNNVSSSWIILATKFRGTIYLCARKTDIKRTEQLNMTDAQKRFCSYGYKFEQYLMTGTDNRKGKKG